MEAKNIFIVIIIGIVFIVSLMVIIGWIFDIPILKSIFPGFITMKFSTAIAFIISGIILLGIFKIFGNTLLNNRVTLFFSLTLLIFIGYILISSLLGIGIPIENLVVKEVADAVITIKLGLPSIATMLNFVLISIAGLFSFGKKIVFKPMAGIICILGISSILGYILNKPFLYFYFENISTGMALHTAFLFVLIGVVIWLLAERTSEEPMFFLRELIFSGFFVIIILIIFMVGLSLQINNLRLEMTYELRDVEEPLHLMIEQSIGYSAILTGTVYESLLHVVKEEYNLIESHKKRYNEISVKLDQLLKFEVKILLQESTRLQEEKDKVYEILNKLDAVNLKLVDLELSAFDAMEKEDAETARSLIITPQYEEYRAEISQLYLEWSALENEIIKRINQESFRYFDALNSVNNYFLILIIILAGIISLSISTSISNSLKQLKNNVEEISKGKLDTRLEKSNIFEVQSLSDSLNRILATMKLAILRTGLTKGELGLEETIKAKEETEEKYKTLVENSPDCIKLIGLDGKLLYMSSGGLKEHRLKNPEDAIGWDYVSSVVEEQRPLVEKAIKDAINGKTITMEVKHVNEKSIREWCLMTLTPVKDSSGKIKYVFGVSRDISEQKKSQSRIKESEEKFKILYENSADAIMTLEPPNWKFTSGNFAAIKMFRVKDEKDFILRELWKYSPKKQPDGQLSSKKAKKMIKKAMKKGSNFFEWTSKRLDGKNFATNVLLTKVEDDKKYIQATIRDITQEKTAEAEMQLYGEILKNMSEGVYLVGVDDGIIKYANPKFEKMFGYKFGELIGKHVSIVNAKTDKDQKQIAKEIMAILHKTGEWHGEIKNKKKDGTPFWCYANVSVVKNFEYGKVLVAVHRDITKEKNAEEKLKEKLNNK